MFNVTRIEESPASLAERRSYKEEDVVKALEDAFHKKGYLCETKEPLDINVEHFIAHQGDPVLKFDWNNLYYSCARCNNIKLQYFNNLLDCCAPEQNVFRKIKLLPPRTPGAKTLVVERQNDDERTKETEKLLKKIYNSDHTINKSITGSYLRKKIHTQFRLLNKWLTIFYTEDSLEHEREDALERVKVLMSDKAQYSAFIKWCILEDTELSELLKTSID